MLVQVRLTPRSAKDGWGGTWTDEKGALWLRAQVRALPEQGKANAALIQLMAKAVGLPHRCIQLEAGDTSRLKRLRITGDAAAIAAYLKKGLDQ